MNKKITIYELLGLIKEDKAPKKISVFGENYEYYASDEIIDYSYEEKETGVRGWLSSVIGNNYIDDIFTMEVEIIEEEKDIEKILTEKHWKGNGRCFITENEHEYYTAPIIIDRINSLIEEVKKLKRGDNERK